MKNLKLSLDDLEVESFQTTTVDAERTGTVRAYITGAGCDTEGICTGNMSCLALCSAYCEANTPKCTVEALTCQPYTQAQTCYTCSCVNTCQNSCYGSCLSCDYYDCNDTCDFQTKCW